MNEKIKKMMDQRNKLLHDMRALINANPNGLNAEDEQKYSAMEADFDKLQKQIDREKNLAALEQTLQQPDGEPLLTGHQNSKNQQTNTDEYKDAFFSYVRYGYSGLDDSERKMLAQFRAAGLEEGVPSKGGYLVPTVIANEIITGLNAESWIRKFADVELMRSTTNIPVDQSVPSFSWMGEKDAYGETDLTFGNIQISAHKMGGIIKISEELLEDSSFKLEPHLRKKIIWGIDAAEEPAFLTGDGVGKPKGIVTSASVGVTAASATAITADEVLDFVYSMSPRYANNAILIASRGWVKAVRKLKDGNGQYIWQPSYRAGEPDTILGVPLRMSEYMPGLDSTTTPAVIADFRFYKIADRGSMYIQRLVEKYADTGEIGFRVRKRVDGKLTLADAAKKFVMGE